MRCHPSYRCLLLRRRFGAEAELLLGGELLGHCLRAGWRPEGHPVPAVGGGRLLQAARCGSSTASPWPVCEPGACSLQDMSGGLAPGAVNTSGFRGPQCVFRAHDIADRPPSTVEGF